MTFPGSVFFFKVSAQYVDNQEESSEDTFEEANTLIEPNVKVMRRELIISLNGLKFFTNNYAISAFSAVCGEPDRHSWANCV